MLKYWLLASFASVFLGGASVWMGGLNQDEGWYLYAANLVSEGKLPYRDFFFTQGPVLPVFYSVFSFVWKEWGLLGARLFNLSIGLIGIVFSCALAYRLAPKDPDCSAKPNVNREVAVLVTFMLLATNLYHLYYLSIPKTYALAALFVSVSFYLLSFVTQNAGWKSAAFALFGGLGLAFAAGTRISLGAMLAVVGSWLLVGHLRETWPRFAWLWFGLGGLLGLLLVYGPFLFDDAARAGLFAAQRYHAARGGTDFVWTIGSFSRLVRWYLPVFVVFGLGVSFGRSKIAGRKVGEIGLLFCSFLAVFIVQMAAPFPYEDYQVPVMALIAVTAAVQFVSQPSSKLSQNFGLLLVLGLSFASSFGSPLLEKWKTNGQDRFWSLKKEKTELAQLRNVARRINALDPEGKALFTQDLYLAIETNRRVPDGLEMGPFAMLDDASWRKLLAEAPKFCGIAAGSGYMFAIEPPACRERPYERQIEYWRLLKAGYEPAFREEAFGQNATPLLVLKRK